MHNALDQRFMVNKNNCSYQNDINFFERVKENL